MLKKLKEATSFIQSQRPDKPQFGIILGTGLGALVDEMDIAHSIDYEDIPHFPVSTVEFHKGKLIFGEFGGKSVVVMQGRFHYYEGYSMEQVVFPVRIMKLLGIEKLFISNAAGGLNSSFQISDLMVINDHINLLPDNPLRGANLDELGGRFPDMFEAYDSILIKKALVVGEEKNIRMTQGVFASVMGPNLETPAEYRYLEKIGADAVGMSTVPENIAAVHMGIPCLAISVITDLCYPGELHPVSIPDILAAAARAEPGLTEVIKSVIQDL